MSIFRHIYKLIFAAGEYKLRAVADIVLAVKDRVPTVEDRYLVVAGLSGLSGLAIQKLTH